MSEGGFTTARELFEALSVPDPIERRRTLAWVADHPREAIKLGHVEGGDVVDMLIGLINREQEYPFWRDLAVTVGVFDAPRVTDFYVELLADAVDTIQAMDAATALERRRDADDVRDRVAEILLSDASEDRIAAAAQVLSGVAGLSAPASIRISLFEDEHEAPAIDAGTTEAWLAELRGRFGGLARDVLEDQGVTAIRALDARWSDLDEATREWLVTFAAAQAPAEAATQRLVVEALESGPRPALAALRALPALPELAVSRDRLAPWAASKHPELRAAAIDAGAAVDAGAILDFNDATAEVRAAAVRALARSEGSSAAGRIASLLGSESLALRNAARDSLVSLGDAAIQHLRPLARSNSVELRAAAVRALLDLGDEEWLAAELLEGSD